MMGRVSFAADGVWTSTDDKTLPADFHIQGEYVGQLEGGAKLGAQVIALGNGAFQAVIYPGGLPGDGWDGKNKSLLDGVVKDGKAVFKPASGNKRYLAGPAEQFSATRKFPPVGHEEMHAAITGDKLTGNNASGASFTLTRTTRKSPSMGKKPPEGALVLFDGSNADQWTGGRVDEATHWLNTDGRDILSKKKFNDYTIHLEFMLPYRPAARGQGRGNSGFYQVDHYEVQILDSFGLAGVNNECGGVYSKVDPQLNMCLPPLTWQTYDIDFTNAVTDDQGKKIKNARLTVRLNGVVIHENQEIDGKTGGSRNAPEGTPGPIKLQGHGNPLQFRNAWIVEK